MQFVYITIVVDESYNSNSKSPLPFVQLRPKYDKLPKSPERKYAID